MMIRFPLKLAFVWLVAAPAVATPAFATEPAKTALAADRPAQGDSENKDALIARGRSLFNQTCAHCHGPDAVTGQSERNLRRLRARYGDDTQNVFHATVVNGRVDKGMPVWGGILDEKTITQIYGYLETIQERPE